MTEWINLTIKTMRNKKAGREGGIIGSFLRKRTEKLYAGNYFKSHVTAMTVEADAKHFLLYRCKTTPSDLVS